MPHELIPLGAAVVITITLSIWLVRKGAGVRNVGGASLILLAALTVTGSMLLHSGEILYNAVNGIEVGMYKRSPGAPHASIFGFSYDFRFYSLQIFGGTLIYWGSRMTISAIRIAKGSGTARREAWRRVLYIFLLVAPLIPMHVFAVATAVLMAMASVGLSIVRLQPADRTEPLPDVLPALR